MIRRSAVEALVEILSLDVLAALRPVRVVRGILRYQSIKWSFECLRQRPFTVVRDYEGHGKSLLQLLYRPLQYKILLKLKLNKMCKLLLKHI